MKAWIKAATLAREALSGLAQIAFTWFGVMNFVRKFLRLEYGRHNVIHRPSRFITSTNTLPVAVEYCRTKQSAPGVTDGVPSTSLQTTAWVFISRGTIKVPDGAMLPVDRAHRLASE
ncbi:hypothetical protein OP10G_3359 [Fimbriimonas ginsengisoli Gsoil 348]|uniref:Uncharacterized protein n=1 Tax=Fimbriimonas ginsengisoli Gsoil 348 TaxID=661478 RepID=A0A068NTP1_FIMGI|nr:hypothetical protein OP10G_3359 [Fimbriimonas ginsengisoli Gsoil 348]